MSKIIINISIPALYLKTTQIIFLLIEIKTKSLFMKYIV